MFAPLAADRQAVSAPSEAWRFLQGESPCGVRINHPLLPSVATATEEVETPNESVEAYTGKHADRRRDRDLQSLIQPRHGDVSSAMDAPVHNRRPGT